MLGGDLNPSRVGIIGNVGAEISLQRKVSTALVGKDLALLKESVQEAAEIGMKQQSITQVRF